jgi:hypothetical protein
MDQPSGLRPESDLLLRLVRIAIATDVGANPAPPGGEHIDWKRLLHVALEHGVMPLLARGLQRCPQAAPLSVRRHIAHVFRVNAQHNLRMMGELIEVLRALESGGVRAVSLKGPALAVALYGDVAMRQFNDIDVLIPISDRSRAQAVLVERGYRFGPADETAVVARRATPEGDITLDLHWEFAERRYRFRMSNAFWERLERRSLGPLTSWQPAPCDYILFLCAHPATHCWSRLGWISDLAMFVRIHRDTLAWPRTLEIARELGAERLFLIGMHLAADLLRLQVPRAVICSPTNGGATATVAGEIRTRLFLEAGNPRRLTGSYGLVEASWLYMRCRERLGDKAAYVTYLVRLSLDTWSITPNTNDRAIVSLPAAIAFLYYVIRPIRLTVKYGLVFARYVLGSREFPHRRPR